MINKKEKELFEHLLEEVQDYFSNKGCNDLDSKLIENWTLEEKQQLMKEFHEWNGDPENYDPTRSVEYLGDDGIFIFLAKKILKLV